MAPVDDLPTRAETGLAYGAAMAASLVWVACVIPGVRLVDPTLPDDLATPMQRGATQIIPSLLLLISAPIGATLARHPLGLRGLLAYSGAFIAFYAAANLASRHPSGLTLATAWALAGLGALSFRDGWRVGRAGAADPPAELPSRFSDVRLAFSLVALVVPAALWIREGIGAAVWIVPFLFVAVSAIGERFAKGPRGLRLAAALCLSVVGAHLCLSVRATLVSGKPEAAGWTLGGYAAAALAVVVFLSCLGWIVAVVRAKPADPA